MHQGTRSYCTGSGSLAEHVLDRADAFGEAHVGERRRGDDVADRVHARLGRAAELVDLDVASLADAPRRCRRGRGSPTAVAVPTDDDDQVGLEGLALAEHHGGAAVAVGLVAFDDDAGANLDAALLEDAA